MLIVTNSDLSSGVGIQIGFQFRNLFPLRRSVMIQISNIQDEVRAVSKEIRNEDKRRNLFSLGLGRCTNRRNRIYANRYEWQEIVCPPTVFRTNYSYQSNQGAQRGK